MFANLSDETIQAFIDIWENLELDLSLVSMSRGVPLPPSPPKCGSVYKEAPKVELSKQGLRRSVGWERGKEEEPVLYLQIQTSFGRRDVGGDMRGVMGRNGEDSLVYSPTSLSSDDSETVVLTPYIVSSPNPSGSGAGQTMFFGGEGNSRNLDISTTAMSDYELSPVNISPVPEELYPPPLSPRARSVPAPAPVAQESLLCPVPTRAPSPHPPGSPAPLQLASMPEVAHRRPHSSNSTSYLSPWDSYFENPRERPVTPARKAASTPSSPSRLRAILPLPISSRSMGANESPIPSLPHSSGSASPPDRPALTRKVSKMLGIDFLPTFTLPHGLRSYSSNLTTASTSPPHFSSGHSSTTASTASYHSAGSSASTPSIPLTYDPKADCATLSTSLNRYTETGENPHLLNKTVAKVTLQPDSLANLNQAFRALPSNQNTSLSSKIRTQTRGPHRLLLLKLLSGPYRSEAGWLSTYCRRPPGTQIPPDDKLAAEIIFGKSPRELQLLKAAFAELNNGWNIRDALAELYPEGSPSAAFGRAVSVLMKCGRDEGEEVLGARRDEDIVTHVEDLYAAEEGSGGVKYLDQRLLLEVVIRRSDAFLRDLCSRFRERHALELVDVVAARERVVVGKGGVWPSNLVCFSSFFLPFIRTFC